jgi:hypothetical protein
VANVHICYGGMLGSIMSIEPRRTAKINGETGTTHTIRSTRYFLGSILCTRPKIRSDRQSTKHKFLFFEFKAVFALRLDKRKCYAHNDPLYKENRIQKPYIAFVGKTETKDHTSEEARYPHNAATNAINTPPSPEPPHRRTSQNDLPIARRRTSQANILAVHIDLQVTTQAPCLRGRRPDVATRTAYA